MDSSNRNCREFIDQLPEAVFLETLKGEILDLNNEACELLGYSKEKLLSMEVDDLVPEGAPAFLPDEIDNATRSGEPLETVNIDSSGNKIPVELRGRIVKLDGEKRILISLREISERKEREKQLERYKMAVEGSDDLMAACDNNYNYIFANRAYKSYCGVEDEDIENYKLKDLVGSETFENAVKPRVDRCLKGKRVEYEMVRSHPSKGDRNLNITYHPLESEDRIHGVVAVMRDVTERKATEKALDEERKKLKNLHDAVDYLQQQDNEEDVLKTGVEVAENILDFEICGIMLLRGDRLVSEALSPGVEFKEPIRNTLFIVNGKTN